METQTRSDEVGATLVPMVNGSGKLRCSDKNCTGHAIAMDRAYVRALGIISKKLGRPVEEEDIPEKAFCRFVADDLRDAGERVYLYLDTIEQVRRITAEVSAGRAFWCAECAKRSYFHPVPRAMALVPVREEARKLLGKQDDEDLLSSELCRVVICVPMAQEKYHRRGVVTPHYNQACAVLLEEEEERTVLAARRERAKQLALEEEQRALAEAQRAEEERFRAAAHPVPKTRRGFSKQRREREPSHKMEASE